MILSRGQVGRQRGNMLPVRHRYRRRRQPDTSEGQWISSLAMIDLREGAYEGDRVVLARIQRDSRTTGEIAAYRNINWLSGDVVRDARLVLGYGFEWHMKTRGDRVVNWLWQEHPGTETSPVTLSTAMNEPDLRSPETHVGGYRPRHEVIAAVTPLSFLLYRYGRPVYRKSRQYEFTNAFVAEGFSNALPPWHNYAGADSEEHTHWHGAWYSELQAFAELVCGYDGASPGDFLVGMLPADHWTRPTGIRRIGVRLGLSQDGYFEGQLDRNDFGQEWDDLDGEPDPRWRSLYGRAYSSTDVDRKNYRNAIAGKFRYGPELSEFGRYSQTPWKYQVFLGGVDITTQAVADQGWQSGGHWNERHILDVTIPKEWEYTAEKIEVVLHFRLAEEVQEAGPITGYASFCVGQTGCGGWSFMAIDIEYDLTYPLDTPQYVAVDGLEGFTEGRLLPLSGRLALRDPVAFPAREATELLAAEPAWFGEFVTGYFPGGSNHFSEFQYRDHMREHRWYEGNVGDNLAGLSERYASGYSDEFTVPSAGHWTGERQVFRKLLMEHGIDERDNASLADSFFPFDPEFKSFPDIVVEPLE